MNTRRDIHAAIRALYPDADPTKNYTIRDDGNGYVISQWLLDEPLPEIGMMLKQTPVSRWADGCQEALTQASGLIKGVLALSIYTRFVQEAVAATDLGAIVPGTQWTKEQAEQILLLWQQTMAWLGEPLVEDEIDTRLDVVSRNA
jgi:hypothetical protein